MAVAILTIAMFAYVAWNADYMIYETKSGRTGMLSWEMVRFIRQTPGEAYVGDSSLKDTLFEPLIPAIATCIDLNERITGRSKEWGSITVTAEGDAIKPDDIRDLPNIHVSAFYTNGLPVDSDSIREISKLSCDSLEICSVNDGVACLSYLRNSSVKHLIITPEAYDKIPGIFLNMDRLRGVTVDGKSRVVPVKMLEEIATNPKIEYANFTACDFVNNCDVRAHRSSIHYLEFNSCDNVPDIKSLGLSNIDALDILRSHDTKFNDSFFDSIKGSNIRRLSLRHSLIPCSLSIVVSGLPKLEELNLSDSSGASLSFSDIDPQCQLRIINASGQGFDRSSICRVLRLPVLAMLLINRSNISDADFLAAVPGQNLVRVDVSGSTLSESAIALFKSRHPKIAIDCDTPNVEIP